MLSKRNICLTDEESNVRKENEYRMDYSVIYDTYRDSSRNGRREILFNRVVVMRDELHDSTTFNLLFQTKRNYLHLCTGIYFVSHFCERFSKRFIHQSVTYRTYNAITLYFLNCTDTSYMRDYGRLKRVTYPVLFRSMRFQSVTLLHPSTETSRSGNTSVTSMDGAPLSYRAAYKLD